MADSAPRAIITGITGQDGSYLAELLLEKGYEVYGLVRRSSTEKFERINHIKDRLHLIQADLADQVSLLEAIGDIRPREVYNLAAQSFVPVSWNQPLLTGDITAPPVLLAVIIAVIVWWRHRPNIRRLLLGEEPKIGAGGKR